MKTSITKEFLGEIDDLVENHVLTHLKCVSSIDCGLDMRAATRVYVGDDCLVVRSVEDGTFQYYGGMEYVNKKRRESCGEYVFYFVDEDTEEHCRVRDAVNRVQMKFDMECEYDMGDKYDCTGTSLKGYVTTTFKHLCDMFGEPDIRSEKTTAEWVLKFEDGEVATIYDWKNKQTPLDPYPWHIGGRKRAVVDRVGYILNASTMPA